MAPNLLDRQFKPTTPNSGWTSDITYVATDEGWLYLAVIIDLFSRQVVGWSMQPHMRRELVIDALHMAWLRRHPPPGLICHSDRGSQYCSADFQKALNRAHLLGTAMHAYWRDDRAAVSVNAVCAMAGVSKPSLYREFGSEDGLTAAVLEHYGQTVLVPDPMRPCRNRSCC